MQGLGKRVYYQTRVIEKSMLKEYYGEWEPKRSAEFVGITNEGVLFYQDDGTFISYPFNEVRIL